MIKIKFLIKDSRVLGFDISGHSGYAEIGSDIVCAAVSSAAYMTVNTITDVICADADVKCGENNLFLLMNEDNPSAQNLLDGFRLHLQELSKDYPKNIRIIYGGVTECLR